MKRVIKKKRPFKYWVLCLQFIVSIIFVWSLKAINILPDIYFFGVVVLVISVLSISTLIHIRKNKRSKTAIISRVISLLMSLFMIAASIYIYKGYIALSEITGNNIKIEKISVNVLNTNSAGKINDVKDKTFAVRDVIDLENTEYAVQKINEKLHVQIKTKKYIDFNTQINDLYKGVTQVLLLNETYRGLILEKYPDFTEKTKVICTVERKVPIETGKSDGDVSIKQTFNIYISGIDVYDTIDTQGRSDVNMVVTVNPATKEILITSIPRDYYVKLYGDDDKYDKLTHAALYGIECSISTLESLLETKIDYYVKVNFSTLINMVNALDGIDVYSPYTFSVADYNFIKGVQHMDGAMALEFARDRNHMPTGDRERGINQEAVLTAIIQKMTSPSVIVNYSDIMKAVAGGFQTNMTTNEITSIIQTQLTDSAKWKITSISLDGDDAYDGTYTFGSEELYVMIPYEDSLNTAIKKIGDMFFIQKTQ